MPDAYVSSSVFCSETPAVWETTVWNVTPCSLVSLYVETAGISETSLPVHDSTRLHIPQDRILNADLRIQNFVPLVGLYVRYERRNFISILRTRRFGDLSPSSTCWRLAVSPSSTFRRLAASPSTFRRLAVSSSTFRRLVVSPSSTFRRLS